MLDSERPADSPPHCFVEMLKSSFDWERVDEVEDEELDTEPAAGYCIREGITADKVVFCWPFCVGVVVPGPNWGELFPRMWRLPGLARLGVLVKA
jgi:hypothetical protein